MLSQHLHLVYHLCVLEKSTGRDYRTTDCNNKKYMPKISVYTKKREKERERGYLAATITTTTTDLNASMTELCTLLFPISFCMHAASKEEN